MHKQMVSILVLVDVALEVHYSYPAFEPSGVSILVLVDVALEDGFDPMT